MCYMSVIVYILMLGLKLGSVSSVRAATHGLNDAWIHY